MNTTTNTRGVSEVMVFASLLHEAKRLRDEFAGLPHSLGYEYTHLPSIDAAIAAAEAALSAPEPAAQGEAVPDDAIFVGTPWEQRKRKQPAERVPYCDAIGEAGEKYHAQFKHAHPLPATWRWEDLWNAMLTASPAPSEGGKGVDCG